MKKQNEEKLRGLGMNRIAQGQAILGQMMKLGHGMQAREESSTPYVVIDGKPVYHISYNPFNLIAPEAFDSWTFKWHKYGEFEHPYMMMGMPDIAGSNTVHIDTSVAGWYILSVRSQLDTWMSGPSYPARSLWTWTPKCPGDNLYLAGDRLFWAGVLAMDGRTNDELFTRFYDESEDIDLNNWSPSSRCTKVFEAIRSKESPIRQGSSVSAAMAAY